MRDAVRAAEILQQCPRCLLSPSEEWRSHGDAVLWLLAANLSEWQRIYIRRALPRELPRALIGKRSYFGELPPLKCMRLQTTHIVLMIDYDIYSGTKRTCYRAELGVWGLAEGYLFLQESFAR